MGSHLLAERFRVAVAVHLFFVRDEQILLLRRANTGYADGLFSVPAGHLDGGESVVAAARREAAEEVGVLVAAEEIVPCGVMHRAEADERIDFFVEVRSWRGEPSNCEPQKCAELVWGSLASLPDDIVPYVRAGLDSYRRREWFMSRGW